MKLASWLIAVGLLFAAIVWNGPQEPLTESISAPNFRASPGSQKARWTRQVEAADYRPAVDAEADAYRNFLAATDLTTTEGLMRWSRYTGIEVLAVENGSDFYYYNAHLLNNAKPYLDHKKLSQLKSRFDVATGRFQIYDGQGRELSIRSAARDVITRVDQTLGWKHYAGFAEPRVRQAALQPYLADLDAVPNRSAIAQALYRLPWNFVATLRGKGIYFSLAKGRSYAASQPLSNEIYRLFAGFVPGVFLEVNSAKQTPRTLIHELCHLLDHTVIKVGYDRLLHPRQYPAYQKLKREKARIFGSGDDQVPDTSFGYVSSYAKTNAQENFAEHCMAFIWEPEKFKSKAEREANAGHPALFRKFNFMQRLLEETSPKGQQLSRRYIALLPDEKSTSPTCRPGESRDRCCRMRLADTSPFQRLILASLDAPVACAVSEQKRIDQNDGDYYYTGHLRCLAEPVPPSAAVRRFEDRLVKAGFNNLVYAASADRIVVSGPVSTQLCSRYQ